MAHMHSTSAAGVPDSNVKYVKILLNLCVTIYGNYDTIEQKMNTTDVNKKKYLKILAYIHGVVFVQWIIIWCTFSFILKEKVMHIVPTYVQICLIMQTTLHKVNFMYYEATRDQ